MDNVILLVEDEPKTGDMLKQALETENINVTWVKDGEEALQVMEEGKFDLIILDLKLPKITGEEVLAGIRKMDPYVEVIVYTAYEEPPVMKQLINLGIEGYFNKGPKAELWDFVAAIKKKLDPFKEDQRDLLISGLPKEEAD